jgi:hypothetical protein
VVAEGTTKTLSQFNNKTDDGQMHDAKILLFLKDATCCTLKVSFSHVYSSDDGRA